MKINTSTVIQACSMNAFVQKISDSITHHGIKMEMYKKFKIINGETINYSSIQIYMVMSCVHRTVIYS